MTTTTGRKPNPVNNTRTPIGTLVRTRVRIPVRSTIGAVSLIALLTLTGCGGEDSDGGNDTATDTASDAGGAPSGGPGGGFDAEQLEEIQDCLKAAGLEDKFPTGPSGAPSDLPSDFPTDLPSGAPSDFPSDLPSDFPTDLGTGGPGAGAGVFQEPEVQEALQACGIDVPQTPGQS